MSELNDPRVLFSAERTLLSWNRTSLSIIAFGFLIERSGLFMPETDNALRSALTFWLGILFIAVGAIASAYSARQYAVVLRTLTPAEFPPGYASKWGLAVNIVVSLLSVALIGVMILGHMW